MIELKNIYKSYFKDEFVLSDLNLKILEGEYVFIHGVSGSGKTTLLNLLSTLDVPSKGEVLYKGKSLAAFSKNDLSNYRNKTIGVIFQKYNLFSYLSVLDNVMFPRQFGHKLSTKDLKSDALKIIEKLGLSHLIDRRVTLLSGGEQQRVCIARVMLQNPEILIADEPTANVDSESQSIIMDVFDELNQKGKTVIVVSHNMIYKSNASRVLTLKNGGILVE